MSILPFVIKEINMFSGWVYNLPKNNECTICRCNLNTTSLYNQEKGIESYIVSGICLHSFHQECIKPWVDKNKYCPICSAHWQYSNNTNNSNNSKEKDYCANKEFTDMPPLVPVQKINIQDNNIKSNIDKYVHKYIDNKSTEQSVENKKIKIIKKLVDSSKKIEVDSKKIEVDSKNIEVDSKNIEVDSKNIEVDYKKIKLKHNFVDEDYIEPKEDEDYIKFIKKSNKDILNEINKSPHKKDLIKEFMKELKEMNEMNEMKKSVNEKMIGIFKKESESLPYKYPDKEYDSDLD